MRITWILPSTNSHVWRPASATPSGAKDAAISCIVVSGVRLVSIFLLTVSLPLSLMTKGTISNHNLTMIKDLRPLVTGGEIFLFPIHYKYPVHHLRVQFLEKKAVAFLCFYHTAGPALARVFPRVALDGALQAL